MEELESCMECGCKHYEDTAEYECIYQTGYCPDCLLKLVEMGRSK